MKALVGSWDHRPYRLLAEITSLRARVAELQQELAEERATNEELRRTLSAALGEDLAVTAEDVEVTIGAG